MNQRSLSKNQLRMLFGVTFLSCCLLASSFQSGNKYATISIRSRVAGASIRSPLYMADSGAAVLPNVTPPAPAAKNSKAWDLYIKSTDVLTTLFPLWTILFAGLALTKPESFAWFTTKYFTGTLGALMLSMGITLTPDDFTRVGKQPGAVIVGFILCYVLCPALGFGLGKAFNLPVDLIAGLVLVGSINGGQASNLCTYIAKGDVALSVLMTTVTTVAGIFMTPLLCKLILGAVVPVDAVGIAVSCIQVVLAPIVVGMTANKFLPKVVEKVLPATPVVGVVSTCLLVASAVSQCSSAILTAGMNLQLPVMLLHLVSGLAGYFIPKALKFNETQVIILKHSFPLFSFFV